MIPAFLNHHPSSSILLFRRNEKEREREAKKQTNRKKSRSILQHRHARFRVRLFPTMEQSRVSREYFDANGTPLVVITSQCTCTAHKFHGDFTSNHLPRNSSKSLMNKRDKSTVRCSIVIPAISLLPRLSNNHGHGCEKKIKKRKKENTSLFLSSYRNPPA